MNCTQGHQGGEKHLYWGGTAAGIACGLAELCIAAAAGQTLGLQGSIADASAGAAAAFVGDFQPKLRRIRLFMLTQLF